MKTYCIIISFIIISFLFLSGCGGSSSTGAVPGTTDNTDNTEETTVEDGFGTFTLKVKIPGSNSSEKAEDLTANVIPYQSRYLRVTMDNQFSGTINYPDIDLSTSNTFTASVPEGINLATIEIWNGEKDTLLAQRKYGFYMAVYETEHASLIMGVSIDSSNLCAPPLIDIPLGTVLYFENEDYTSERTVSLESGSVTVGPIPAAEPNSTPSTPDVFHALPGVFDTAGLYKYDSGYGGDGTESYRVLVYNLPSITSITDGGGDNWDSVIEESPVNFTVTGTGFGSDRELVEGDLKFFKVRGWEPVGEEGISAGEVWYTSLFIYNGTPWIAYRDIANGAKITVMKFNGTAWETVGSPGFSPSSASYTSLYIYEGTPYVIFRDEGDSNKARVMKYEGGAWVSVGGGTFSTGYIWNPSIYVYEGTPYVAYMDGGYAHKATVMKFNGTDWVAVGSPGFSEGSADMPSIQVYNDIPYVAFVDEENDYKAAVMMYNGSSWVSVGSPTISAGRTSWTHLFIDNSILYVSYRDNANGYKVTVMKYDGSTWTPVGSEGFTTGIASYNSFYVYNGVPYVSYADGTCENRITVMKFNGTDWVTVGTTGFSTGEARYTSLSLYNGIPYVAYEDFGNDRKATVMKLGLSSLSLSPTINTWTENEITGNINIPGGKYYIQATVRGTNTTDEVYYHKGTGTYTVTVE